MNENVVGVSNPEAHHKLKAHKIGDTMLTVTTLILVVIALYFKMQFAPFIILLMSSRIGSSIYIFVKTSSKKELSKLVVWFALLGKSVYSCWQFLAIAAIG